MEHIEPIGPESVTHVDESLWKTWQERSRLRDERAAASRGIVLKCFGIAALLVAVLFWIRA
ncbi:MAG: hypothetical protein LAQ30_32070 [Acidobacteriia bacterium]|nr:hypothetical protein [Terriglobia bacterium]